MLCYSVLVYNLCLYAFGKSIGKQAVYKMLIKLNTISICRNQISLFERWLKTLKITFTQKKKKKLSYLFCFSIIHLGRKITGSKMPCVSCCHEDGAGKCDLQRKSKFIVYIRCRHLITKGPQAV